MAVPRADEPRAASRAGRWQKAGVVSGVEPPRGGQGQPDQPLALTLPRLPPAVAAGSSAFHGTALSTAAWDQPASAYARAAQRIRDRLAAESAARGRKIVVLGLEPGLGTSTLALNLALAAAREGAIPLLVDAAKGAATLSQHLAPDATEGLDDVVSGRAGLVRASLQDGETGGFFLPRPDGAVTALAAEALERGLFAQVRRFDAVILDGGALIDGSSVAALAATADDLVVLLPRGGEAVRALQLLRRALGPDAGKARVLASAP
jgi:Mrp family chromosome partitioning ATPase